MTDLMDNWALWERVLAGERVDSPSMAYLLESPSEYLLRRLLRTLPHRDELLRRFGTYIFEPPAELSQNDAAALAAECIEERARLADDLGVDRPFERVVRIADDATNPWGESVDDDIRELLFGPAYKALAGVPGGYALKEIGLGVSGNNIWTSYYLVAPLTNGLIDLSAGQKLAKGNWATWLSTSGLIVRPTQLHAPHNQTAWNPVLAWPTEAEIRHHLNDEATIKEPGLDAEVVSKLVKSGSPFASTMALYHQNLPVRHLPEFATSNDTRLRTAAARNQSTDATILAQLAQDADSGVRLGVAVNPATAFDVIKSLADDVSETVRGAAARNLGKTIG